MSKIEEFKEQKKENPSITKVDILFKKFLERLGGREAYNARGWFKLRYTYLPTDERELMRRKILSFTGLVDEGVQEENVKVQALAMPDKRSKRIKAAKEDLVEDLEIFSKYYDNKFKRECMEKPPIDREFDVVNKKARLLIKERVFESWKEREVKLKNASREAREILWIEEYGKLEIEDLKYRVSRLLDSGASVDDVKPYADAIKRWEKVEEDMGKFGWGKSQEKGESIARKESIKEGEPVAYVGDFDTKIEIQKTHWYYGKLNKAGIEDEIDEYRAETEYIERIVKEVQPEESRSQAV